MKYKCYLCQHEWDYEYSPQYRYIGCPNCGKSLIEVEARKTEETRKERIKAIIDCLGNIKNSVSKLNEVAIENNAIPDYPTQLLDISCMCDEIIAVLGETIKSIDSDIKRSKQ